MIYKNWTIKFVRRWGWSSVWRLNGGGYMYGANPYAEWHYGFVVIRRYSK